MGVLGTLGSLNVLLSADTAQFSTAMDKAAFLAERDLQRISSKAKLNSTLIISAFAAAGTAIAVSVKKTIDHADEIGKMASSLGLTTEQLSSLEYAAKLSNVEIDGLRTSFQKFNKTVFDGANGVKLSSDAFKSLNISVTDNSERLKSTYDLFLESADALSKMTDGVQKSATAQILFGKSGAQMIPLLNSGKDGIRALADEAQRLGIVISSDVAAAAEKINDDMNRLVSGTQGVVLSFTSGLLPSLVSVTENLTSSTASMEGFRTAGESVGKVVTALASGIMTINAALKSYGDTMRTISATLLLLKEFKFREIGELWKDYSADQKKTFDDLAISVDKNWKSISGSVTEASSNAAAGIENLDDKIKKSEDSTKRLESGARDLGFTFQSAFEDAVLEGKNLSDVLSGLLKDIERIVLRTAVTGPLADALSAGVISFFPTSSAHGNVFSGNRLVPFLNGGLITRPSIFPMANGGVGLAGEAGTEAIMPLFRTGSGDLGVKSGGGGVEINVYAPEGSNVKTESQKKGSMEQINIMIDEATADAVSNSRSRTYKALKKSFGLRQSLTAR